MKVSFILIELWDPIGGRVSGRSSIDSIEGSTLSDISDLDNHDVLDDTDTSTIMYGHFSGSEANSFDTDDDDDENINYSLTQTKRNRTKDPQRFIKCLKDSIINSLASTLIQKFFVDEQALLQRYARIARANNSIIIRTEPRPSSVPPRSSPQGRTSQTTIQPNFPMPPAYRPTTDTSTELESILHVKRLGGIKSNPNQTATVSPSSPRKPQGSLPPTPIRVERISTSLSMEKRNQQQISLVGTAITNPPPQVILSAPQSSQAHTRQTTTTTRRHGSATTISSTTQSSDSIIRLPPILSEHLNNNDSGMINRSHTISTTIIESVPTATRIVSSKSTTSNFSSAAKARAFPNFGKLQRTSRSIIIAPNKDFSNSPSISPIRSITANISSNILKTTAAARSHQQPQQKSFVTTKSSPPSSSSTAIKVPATHMY
ncbi:unnamed protein product [Rotaria socialis]|uniref:Uncharacterized protein n=1 Tax=Rotaria socialis TaxID=392032 RepID=A0A820S2C9_9BILA|nr:unnamed protein product [Rotaria socialis]CAF4821149.1 unnamed protein product [Rotaria socialis]